MSRRRSRLRPAKIDWNAVGRRIRELRGLYVTQADFADQIGVTQAYLSMIEHGKREIGFEVLLTISQEFGKSLEWLLTGKE